MLWKFYFKLNLIISNYLIVLKFKIVFTLFYKLYTEQSVNTKQFNLGILKLK